jgi:hypothetical protein
MWLKTIRSTVGSMQLGSRQSLRRWMPFLLVIPLFSCSSSTPWTTQVCDSCNWEAAKIQFVDAIPTDTVEFTAPIAIEYFNLASGNFPDSATADRFFSDHQWRYGITDQYGYYTAIVRPILERYGIPTIDTIRWRNVLFFTDSISEYVVDAGRYRSNDGVLLFAPGKAPIFWTRDVFRNNCTDTTFVKCYFGK